MCCVTTIFLVFGSRLAILYWWLTDPQRFASAVSALGLPASFNLPVWACTLLGGIFLPWTTLAYLYVFADGIAGLEWVMLAVGFLVDVAGHGGSYRNRRRIRRRHR
jgi:hypothetical protein